MLCYERLTDRLTVSRTTPTIAMAFRALKACATRFGTPSRRLTRPRLFAHREIRSRGEVLDLLENETGMHSCLASKPKIAGWRRRQEEASPWSREYRPRSGQARSSTSC